MARLMGKNRMVILSACITQVIEFCDRDAYNQYIQKLYEGKKDYCVDSIKEDPETHKVKVWIRKQYNDNPLEGGKE